MLFHISKIKYNLLATSTIRLNLDGVFRPLSLHSTLRARHKYVSKDVIFNRNFHSDQLPEKKLSGKWSLPAVDSYQLALTLLTTH